MFLDLQLRLVSKIIAAQCAIVAWEGLSFFMMSLVSPRFVYCTAVLGTYEALRFEFESDDFDSIRK